MKHHQRLAAFKQVERLNNMRLASRRDLEDFCLKNKAYLDEALAPLAANLASLIPRTKKPPKRWEALRPQDRDRLTKKLRYKDNIYQQLLQMGFVGADIGTIAGVIKEHPRRSYLSRQAIDPRRENKKGTPQTRLEEKCRNFTRSLNKNRTFYIDQYDFISNLHPDDASWELNDAGGSLHVTVARNIIYLNKLLPGRSIIAARSYMEDLEVPVQVYHCATLHYPRQGPAQAQVQTCYIGRATLPRNGGVWISDKAKTPTTAFRDAKAAWTRAMSAIIYTEEKE